MDGFTWAAFACYLVSAIGASIGGLVGMSSREFLPYHAQALGKTWAELDGKLKTLLLAFMSSVGLATVAVGLSVIAMLIFAFISRELWSYYTIPVISLVLAVHTLIVMLDLKKKTGAKTPYIPAAVGIVLIVIGFVLSFF